jgi:hypothetical protein
VEFDLKLAKPKNLWKDIPVVIEEVQIGQNASFSSSWLKESEMRAWIKTHQNASLLQSDHYFFKLTFVLKRLSKKTAAGWIPIPITIMK